ncbi:MAG: FAD-binding oxidoreductase [Sulfitobacter sp.]|nr:FAD-binding oxidoreductase [Sulfitobacter sp.]
MNAFPFSIASPVTYPGPLPEEVDVVVIGAGVIGVCTALYLARAGQRVALIEKGRVAAEQSGRNWGWIRQQGRDPAELPIMVEARRLWLELAGETNVDFGLREGGVAFVATNQRQMEGFAQFLPFAEGCGVDTRLLDAAEVRARLPGIRGKIAGAMLTPSDMRAEPWLAVPALAGIAVRAGVKIIENCAVRRLEVAGGRVTGVQTEQGAVRAPSVVLAGGAWSALFLRAHGIDLPQLSVRQTVMATQPLPEITGGAWNYGRLAMRRRIDGGYTLASSGASDLMIGPDAFRAAPFYMPQLRAAPVAQGYRPWAPSGFPDAWGTPRRWAADEVSPFERMRVLDPPTDAAFLRRLARRFARTFPDMPAVSPRASWAGMIDAMPDVVPVIDHARSLPGLIIGTGMSGHGFGIGPGVGRVLAALAMGRDPGHDLTRFRSDRFRKGSKLTLGPTF